MNGDALFVGLDCGTQGTKALVVDGAGTVLGRGYHAHRLTERASGAREQEPAWWVEAVRGSLMQATAGLTEAQLQATRAMGVSGQQHGLVVLDRSFQVIRPAKLWNDTETFRQNAEIMERFGGERAFFDRFGIVSRTGYTLSKLLWLAQKEPENFARIAHILLPHEYLNFWLTGELRAEFGDASGTAFFDVRRREWITEVLDAIDGGNGVLRSALPALVSPTDTVGTLRREVAEEFGLPAGCLVSAGGGDNMMGAIGTGNIAAGAVTLSLGTSSTVYSFADTPPDDPTGDVAPFCSSSGGWLPLVCTMNATNVVTSMAEALQLTVADLEEALLTTAPGADGLVMLPFLNGERTPDLPRATGSLYGLSAQTLSPSHLLRAAVEGVSFGILNGLDLVLRGVRPRAIVAIGGGARSRQWRQLLADATGAPVQVPVEEESGCLGAAVQACVAASRADGQELSFPEATKRMVRLHAELTCDPVRERYEAYQRARQAYNARLANYIAGYSAESQRADVEPVP